MQEQQLPTRVRRQPAPGRSDGVARGKLERLGKECESLRRGLRAEETVRVQELFPLALARLGQRGRSREALDEAPGRRQRPLLEGFQGDRIVFLQGFAQLIDQGRAFLDQGEFIAAKQTQFRQQRVQRLQLFPSAAVDPQRIRKSPGSRKSVFTPLGALRAQYALPALGWIG